MKRRNFFRQCAISGASVITVLWFLNQSALSQETHQKKGIILSTVLSHSSPLPEALDIARMWIKQVAERLDYLPGWTSEKSASGCLERIRGMICENGLMLPTWSRIIPQSALVIYYPYGRLNLVHQRGTDLGYISKKYRVPIVASNQVRRQYSTEAGIFNSDGTIVAHMKGKPGNAVAEVNLGQTQPNTPTRIRHWDGEPLEMLNRLDKY